MLGKILGGALVVFATVVVGIRGYAELRRRQYTKYEAPIAEFFAAAVAQDSAALAEMTNDPELVTRFLKLGKNRAGLLDTLGGSLHTVWGGRSQDTVRVEFVTDGSQCASLGEKDFIQATFVVRDGGQRVVWVGGGGC